MSKPKTNEIKNTETDSLESSESNQINKPLLKSLSESKKDVTSLEEESVELSSEHIVKPIKELTIDS